MNTRRHGGTDTGFMRAIILAASNPFVYSTCSTERNTLKAGLSVL